MGQTFEQLIAEMTPSYGMFTQQGNEAVDQIVSFHKQRGSSWAEVQNNLELLAEAKFETSDKKPSSLSFAEATDTEVRERVWMAMGFDK